MGLTRCLCQACCSSKLACLAGQACLVPKWGRLAQSVPQGSGVFQLSSPSQLGHGPFAHLQHSMRTPKLTRARAAVCRGHLAVLLVCTHNAVCFCKSCSKRKHLTSHCSIQVRRAVRLSGKAVGGADGQSGSESDADPRRHGTTTIDPETRQILFCTLLCHIADESSQPVTRCGWQLVSWI